MIEPVEPTSSPDSISPQQPVSPVKEDLSGQNMKETKDKINETKTKFSFGAGFPHSYQPTTPQNFDSIKENTSKVANEALRKLKAT